MDENLKNGLIAALFIVFQPFILAVVILAICFILA